MRIRSKTEVPRDRKLKFECHVPGKRTKNEKKVIAFRRRKKPDENTPKKTRKKAPHTHPTNKRAKSTARNRAKKLRDVYQATRS